MGYGLFENYSGSKYKEGNNCPSSVNQISLVHYHDKAGNKCYTQDNTDTSENPSVWIGVREELTSPVVATHPQVWHKQIFCIWHV